MLAAYTMDGLGMAMLSAMVFGIIGILLMLLGFKLFDWMTPRLDVQKELSEKHNLAVAIVIAATLVGISIILARAIGD